MKERTDQEASPFQSKKFIAFLVANSGVTVLTGLLIISFWGKLPVHVAGVLLGFMILQGFVAVGYLVGATALDKFVRVARIVTGSGQGVSMKGITIAPKGEKKPPTEATMDSEG